MLSIAFWTVFISGLRMTVVPPEDCGSQDVNSLEEAAIAAANWIERSQNLDGSYVYEYNADTDTGSSDYNEVRHAGVTVSLYQAAGRLQRKEEAEAAGETNGAGRKVERAGAACGSRRRRLPPAR